MKTSPPISALRRDFREGVLDFLWRQWVQLGVSGARDGPDDWAIDPEALLIHSLERTRRDPRLFDEILDWLTVNAQLVSMQRLRNLLRDRGSPVVHASLAWAAAQGAVPFRRSAPGSLDREPRPLFRSGEEALPIKNPDPVFETFGLLRPLAKRTGKSKPVDPSRSTNLAFRLRLLFGIGTRAEIVRVLLTSGEETSSGAVADAAAYARRNVADALGGLERAGVIISIRRGRVRGWRIDREEWSRLLGLDVLDLPRFVDWIRLLRAMEAIDRWFETDAEKVRGDYIRSSTARELLDEIREDLKAARITVPASVEASAALAQLDDVAWSLLSFLRVGGKLPSRQHAVDGDRTPPPPRTG